jgi:methionyl aminopeptidase
LAAVGGLAPSAPHLEGGWGFPTGVSVNQVAAHYTPNYGEAERKLEKSDVMKVDFGVHVNGSIIDCAWTVAFEEQYDPLLQATIEGTNVGIKTTGVDARFVEIAKNIQEVIESHEVAINNKTYKIKSIRNLNGHSIERYRIHGGKSVPINYMAAMNMYPEVAGVDGKMKENEVYAIETFASTGKGVVIEEGECSHYMKNTDFPINKNTKISPQAKTLLAHVEKEFSTLPFCRRWLDDQGQTRHLLPLKTLVDAGYINPYPPLCDVKGSFTSQMEHTIYIKPNGPVEVLSRGDDY